MLDLKINYLILINIKKQFNWLFFYSLKFYYLNIFIIYYLFLFKYLNNKYLSSRKIKKEEKRNKNYLLNKKIYLNILNKNKQKVLQKNIKNYNLIVKLKKKKFIFKFIG